MSDPIRPCQPLTAENADAATLMVEILKDNARPEAAAVYGTMDMPWARLAGQIVLAYAR